MKLKVIITGATGMVGEGVLHECLQHSDVESVLVVSRRSVGLSHPKLTEVTHHNFMDVSPIRGQLKGYNACFFCLGVSSVGMKEEKYYELTYNLTLGIARILAEENPDMVFSYISGSGTDSSEKGKSMWARVKGKTENDLMKLPFKKVYAFRPGYLHPTAGLKNVNKLYYLVAWLYPVWRRVFPNFVTTLKELGLAMINATLKNYPKAVIEVPDIRQLAKE